MVYLWWTRCKGNIPKICGADMSKGTFRWDRVNVQLHLQQHVWDMQVLIGDRVIFSGYDERQTYGDLWVFVVSDDVVAT